MSENAAASPTIFTPAYYARLHQVEAGHWWYLGMRSIARRWLDRALDGRRGLGVLDVGCGAGFTMRWLRRYAAPGGAVGVDLDETALYYTRQVGEERALRASASSLPFRDQCFDLLHCADVLQHLPAGHDLAALRESGRVLRGGGLLLLRANAAHSTGDDDESGSSYRRYRLAGLTALVESAGLRVLRATHVNVVPSLVAELRARFSPRSPGSGHHAHGQGLPTLPRAALLNRLLAAELELESALLSVPGCRSSWGHSTLVLARKP